MAGHQPWRAVVQGSHGLLVLGRLLGNVWRPLLVALRMLAGIRSGKFLGQDWRLTWLGVWELGLMVVWLKMRSP